MHFETLLRISRNPRHFYGKILQYLIQAYPRFLFRQWKLPLQKLPIQNSPSTMPLSAVDALTKYYSEIARATDTNNWLINLNIERGLKWNPFIDWSCLPGGRNLIIGWATSQRVNIKWGIAFRKLTGLRKWLSGSTSSPTWMNSSECRWCDLFSALQADPCWRLMVTLWNDVQHQSASQRGQCENDRSSELLSLEFGWLAHYQLPTTQ